MNYVSLTNSSGDNATEEVRKEGRKEAGRGGEGERGEVRQVPARTEKIHGCRGN